MDIGRERSSPTMARVARGEFHLLSAEIENLSMALLAASTGAAAADAHCDGLGPARSRAGDAVCLPRGQQRDKTMVLIHSRQREWPSDCPRAMEVAIVATPGPETSSCPPMTLRVESSNRPEALC